MKVIRVIVRLESEEEYVCKRFVCSMCGRADPCFLLVPEEIDPAEPWACPYQTTTPEWHESEEVKPRTKRK